VADTFSMVTEYHLAMLAQASLLAPVIALALWTHVMFAWMYATRIPAIQAAKMPMDPNAARGAQMATLPPRVRWKADNYNHLMEQPTVFYAVAIVLALIDKGDSINLELTWAYVALRVIHSLVQSLVNKIEVRFAVFSLSSLVLIGMTINAARLVF
jgi:hypothetical protein